jgi:hypothetical protein
MDELPNVVIKLTDEQIEELTETLLKRFARKQKIEGNEFDQKLAWAVLLQIPEYAALPHEEQRRVLSRLSDDWLDSPETNMMDYARAWAARYFATGGER